MHSLSLAVALGLLALVGAGRAAAQPVGEIHLVTADRTASMRDSGHSSEIRVTVWYPAVTGATERPIVIGPPNAPLFKVGTAAADAAIAPEGGRLPVILLSHGYGGTARIMGWFGIAMARTGAIVIAVDHPGNNTIDPKTVEGALLFWQRPDDLQAALASARADPTLGPRIDPDRIGVAGFSAGGFTSLAEAGARVDLAHLTAFCVANPDDGVCRPQPEFPITQQQVTDFYHRPEMAAETVHAADDHSIADVRAVFVMAPALVQAFAPASLAALHIPVAIVLGDADKTVPPATNGMVAASLIPGAALQVFPRVGHEDFLATCTPAGRSVIPFCDTAVPQEATHRQTIDLAEAFFAAHLKAAK